MSGRTLGADSCSGNLGTGLAGVQLTLSKLRVAAVRRMAELLITATVTWTPGRTHEMTCRIFLCAAFMDTKHEGGIRPALLHLSALLVTLVTN